MRSLVSSICVVTVCIASFFSTAANAYGLHLEGFEYPYPIRHFRFESQKQNLDMAYMDVAPTSFANGKTVVLLHGKNFCGATWEETIDYLTDQGYRVVVPDQVGFCASSKPKAYQYSFQQLARNTEALLNQLSVSRIILIGHSTGGMLATRFALMYPDQVTQLILVNPIGLEDWKAMGVPSRSVDDWYARELKISKEKIRAYEQSVYYRGQWQPQYDRWVDMLAGLNEGEGHELVAWNSALIYDMIFTQPVVYEFHLLRMPTTLMLGTDDVTAIGSDIALPEVKEKVGKYKTLGPKIASQITKGKLVEFPGYGHAPQIENPVMFHQALMKVLSED